MDLSTLTKEHQSMLGKNIVCLVKDFLKDLNIENFDKFNIDAKIKISLDGFNLGLDISYPPLKISPLEEKEEKKV